MNTVELHAKWKDSFASERANKDSFLNDLCDVLDVPRPDPKSGDPERDQYVFEREAVLLNDGANQTIGFIDLYKRGAVILEAKQGSEAGSKKIGAARRGTPSWNMAMQEAYGQALGYAQTVDPPPPFIIIADIGYCFDLYATFDRSRNYLKFPDAINSRISLEQMARDPRHVETLRAIFTDPHSLDPAKRTSRVTREIAGHIATLARTLDVKHDPETVAKFLMRCLFTMFAEDVDLLPKGLFANALTERWVENPDAFTGEVGDLWAKMNEGGYLFGAGNIWKFNGGLFDEPAVLPLTREQLKILAAAATSNWADVEPAIFGTLLERALDPKERHRLGAHYTPRAYVERLVRPTIEEPLREEWDNVRAQVQTLVAGADPDKNIKEVAEARKIVGAFYDRLTRIRVLDPACGSGNFLYVALDLFKRIENEVLDYLANLGDARPLFSPSGRTVTPEQFLGIEIKPWAKEITELVLWIGYLQWQIRTRGWKSHPQEPILRDYHNIECRDAVLAYDGIEPLLDDDGRPVTRWDGETMKIHSVTGEDVPDDTAQVPIYRYVSPRKAEWPEADYIVGNPPYIGNKRMRRALSEEYVDALRSVHPEVTDSADYVMYWWNSAAQLARTARIRSFGLITTNSIGQSHNRRVIDHQLVSTPPLRLIFVVPDHPWVDALGGANVRVSMICGTVQPRAGKLCIVERETEQPDGSADVTLNCQYGDIRSDLTIGGDRAEAVQRKLAANSGLAFMGVTPAGDGFRFETPLDSRLNDESVHLHKYITGRDILGTPAERRIIDFHGLEEHEARARAPHLYEWILERVKPARIHNPRRSYRERWWLFAEGRPALRGALVGLKSYIATVRVSKFKVFLRVDAHVLPDSGIIAIALEDDLFLGVLSSRVHVTWALEVSGTLEDRPYWNVSVAFDPFPFPSTDNSLQGRIRGLASELDAHRKRQQALHPDLTITAMYNVLEKLRRGESLTPKETNIHENGLVSTLKQIHDDLDAAVFDAYGWSHDLSDEEILERLVALNADRAEEEKRGIIRWLRPEFQNPAGTALDTQTTLAPLHADESDRPRLRVVGEKHRTRARKQPWPKALPEQIAALRDYVATANGDVTTDGVVKAFSGARTKDVELLLDSLTALGFVIAIEKQGTKAWRALDHATAGSS